MTVLPVARAGANLRTALRTVSWSTRQLANLERSLTRKVARNNDALHERVQDRHSNQVAQAEKETHANTDGTVISVHELCFVDLETRTCASTGCQRLINDRNYLKHSSRLCTCPCCRMAEDLDSIVYFLGDVIILLACTECQQGYRASRKREIAYQYREPRGQLALLCEVLSCPLDRLQVARVRMH